MANVNFKRVQSTDFSRGLFLNKKIVGTCYTLKITKLASYHDQALNKLMKTGQIVAKYIVINHLR